MWLKCDECGEYLQYDDIEDAPTRRPELEDGTTQDIVVCPLCGGNVYEVKTCGLCGGCADDKEYCQDCVDKVWDDFEALMIRKYNPHFDKPDSEVGNMLADIIAEY